MPKRQTRQRIIETADRLFYENGFDTTSFAEIADNVGVSRGNFYHHFKTKDSILDAVIELRTQATRDLFDEWERTSDHPKDRIQAFVKILIRNEKKIMQHGCPVGTLSAELAKLEHGSTQRAIGIFRLFRNWLREQFDALGHKEDADILAMHVLSRSQGIASLANAFHDKQFVRREITQLFQWLDRLDHNQTDPALHA